MLATFNYHTNGSLEALEFILDDDNSKSGMSYKNIKVDILHPDEILIDENIIIVPTSLENQLTGNQYVHRLFEQILL